MPAVMKRRRILFQGSDLTRDLVSHWRLDDANGAATWADSWGPHHLTNNNGTTSGVGKIGNAASLAVASNQSLSTTDKALLSAGDNNITLGIWFNVASLAANRCVASKYDGSSNNREWLLRVTTSGAVRLDASSDGGAGGAVNLSTAATVSTGTWNLLFFWHDKDANTLNLQLNNGAVDSLSHSAGLFDGTAAFYLGAYESTGEPFDGRLDLASFWRRVLTAKERSDLWNGGNGRDVLAA